MRLRTFRGAVAALLLALPAAAQEQTGSIVGVVKDASGAVLPGATVEARSPSSIGVRSTVTDEQGVVPVPGAAAGHLRSQLPRFRASSRPRSATSDVDAGQAAHRRSDAEARRASAETVTVSVRVAAHRHQGERRHGEPRLADDRPDPERPRPAERPRRRFPARTTRARGGGLMIDGASGSENRFLVDGVDRTNARTGSAHGHHRHRESSCRTSSTPSRSSSPATTRNTARRSAASSTPSPRAAATVPRLGRRRTTPTTSGWATSARRCGRCRATRRGPNTSRSRATRATRPTWCCQLGGPILEGQGLVLRRRTRRSSTRRSARSGGRTPARSRRRRRSTTAIRNNKVDQLQRDLAAGQLAARALHRQQRDAEGRPRTSRTSSRTAPARRARRRSTRARRSSPSSSRMPTAASSTGRSATKTFVNATVSYLGYGSHSAGGDYYHGTRRTFSTPNIGLLDVPANLQQRQRLRRQQLELVLGAGRLPALQPLAGRDPVRALEGRARVQDRRALRAHRQPGEPGPAGARTSPSTGAASTARRAASTRTGKYGYFVVRRQLHGRRHQGDQPQLLRAGSVDGQQQADGELRPAPRERRDPVLQPERAGREVRMGRQDRAARSASPTTSRATARRSSTAPTACSTTR